MKKPFEYLMNIVKEIEDTSIFPFAEEQWAVEEKIAQGSKKYITILNDELNAYLDGDLKNKRAELTEEQLSQIRSAQAEAMRKAESRFGSFV